MVYFNYSVFLRYTWWNFPYWLYLFIFIMQGFVQSYCFILVAYYFAKKSAKLEKNGGTVKIVKMLRIGTLVTVPIYIILVIMQTIYYSFRNTYNSNTLCKTGIFIVPESVNFIVAALFSAFCYRIIQQLNAYLENQRIMQDYDLENIEQQAKQAKKYTQTRQAINTATRNLMLLLVSFVVTTFYLLLYSSVLVLVTQADCQYNT